MRARLMMKLMGIVVMLIMTVVGARSCSNSSPTSPLNPTNLAQNGIAGICADQQAASDSSGDGSSAQSPSTAVSQADLSQLQASNPGGVQALQQALGDNLSCPTTTIDNAGN